MVGILFKYDADPQDEWLKDKRDTKICAGFCDPDFFTNPFPIWSICGPYVRNTLRRGDVVFFLPSKKTYEEAGYTDYICAGMLRVTGKMDKNTLLEMPQITDEYKRNYLATYEAHQKVDRNKRTEKIRHLNIVYGEYGPSKWFGRNSINLNRVLSDLNLSRDLTSQRIKNLSENEYSRLYNYYLKYGHHEI